MQLGSTSNHATEIRLRDDVRAELAEKMERFLAGKTSKQTSKPAPKHESRHKPVSIIETCKVLAAIKELATIEISGVHIRRSAYEVAKIMRGSHRHKRFFRGITEETVQGLVLEHGIDLASLSVGKEI